jgi:hypothetical protein
MNQALESVVSQKLEDRIWLPPKPSRAERKIPRKSKNHFVGELTFGEELGQGQTIGFESLLEHNICLIGIYRPGVVDIREQVKTVFSKANGRTGNHFIDYVTIEEGKRRTGIIVKPEYKAVQTKFRDHVSRVAAAAIPSVVDRVVVATERVFDPLRLARVEQFHASRFAQPVFDNAVKRALKNFDGRSSIRDFLEIAGVGTDGFHAVVRMVRFNLLKALVPGLITLSSPIQVPEEI